MTLLTAHHLLPRLREELGLALPREEPVLDLGEQSVRVGPAHTGQPHQADPQPGIDVQGVGCEADVPTEMLPSLLAIVKQSY